MDKRIKAMEKIFSPRSVAFIGASNNLAKWGGIIFHNLVAGGYEGAVYPVNPKEERVQGLSAYPSVSAIPEPVDLAVFTIPADKVAAAVKECAAKGIPAGVVISAGFSELGEVGRELQEEIVSAARAGGMVLVGPNGQGIAAGVSKLYPWMPVVRPAPGSIGIASQSGNVCTVLCEQLAEFGFGCSKVISAGNCGDLGFPDYLEYFRQDAETKVIVLYIEGVGEGREFFAAARKTALEKPVVVVKSGRTAEGARAAATHTGVLAGSDVVFDATCRQLGLIRVETLEEAVILAATFVNTPLPQGKRVGVITGGGGFGVLAADACTRRGLDLVRFSEATIAKLREKLPPWWAPNNPVDMVAGIGFGGPRELIPILMESGEVDAVILLGIGWIYSMLDQADSKIDFHNPADEQLQARLQSDLKFCELILEYCRKWGKPLLLTSSVARLVIRRGYPGLLRFLEEGIMLYPAIEDAVKALAGLAERSAFLRAVKGGGVV